MAAAITTRNIAPSLSYDRYSDHPQVFLELLLNPASTNGSPTLSRSQTEFIRSLHVTMPPVPDVDQARSSLGELAAWFCDLQRKVTPENGSKIAYLREITPYPERTERFIDKSTATSGDFTNVGGINIELCHLKHLHPKFSLTPQ